MAGNWNWASNYDSTGHGRIWHIWDSNIIRITVVCATPQSIHGIVHIYALNMTLSLSLSLSTRYGLHTVEAMRSMWTKLKGIHMYKQRPWVAVGSYVTVLEVMIGLMGI